MLSMQIIILKRRNIPFLRHSLILSILLVDCLLLVGVCYFGFQCSMMRVAKPYFFFSK
ncbi:unnamed protein product [Wuchereria bancrofti]|uniref:Uncharacterized protein n=1 Tax=Wuchereria bancrofti TaxID=6293 RepID=A0A3P7E486_WUCBA|nr:unnamed protein product [Wuchereria bancrofti]